MEDYDQIILLVQYDVSNNLKNNLYCVKVNVAFS